MAKSTKLSVAVHLLSLVDLGPADKMTSEFIAASVNTNPVVIRRLMSQLKKAGLLHSERGTSQTYLLKEAKDITLYDIYLAVEPDPAVFGIHQDTNQQCIVGATIQETLKKEFAQVQQTMEAKLNNLTLAEVIHELKV